MSEQNGPSLDTLVSLAKRRGFVFPASEIYGGVAGVYDLGPYGAELAKNLRQAWWKYFVTSRPNIYGLDSAILQHQQLWQASGHVAGFTDPMVEDTINKKRYRADHMAGIDSNNLDELKAALKDKKSPDGNPLSDPKVFNMMLKTYLGAVEDESTLTYLRPETAGGIYINYENVRETMRSKIPFGIAQVGKAFRNEISPRDWMFRKRELEQMELQYFVRPENEKAEYENLRQITWDFFEDVIGLNKSKLSWHEHGDNERAHYAAAAHDVYYEFPIGPKELAGVHDRTDFDLKNHQEHSGKDLTYFDQDSGQRFVPFVIESSMGLDRLFMAVLTDSYHEEEVKGEKRVVLKFKPGLAPVGVAVLPLSKNERLVPLAHEVYQTLVNKTDLTLEYDETQSIGRRYRRQDEIGTPKCVTIDFESLEDKAVTVRDRDTMEQERVPIDKLTDKLG